MSTEHIHPSELTDRELRAELETATGPRKAALEVVRDQRKVLVREIGPHRYGFRGAGRTGLEG